MSADSPFLQMKDARSAARRKERAADIDADSPSARDDWADVAELGFRILSKQGKDLEAASWMIEALLRLDGFAGLYTGFIVAAGLVRQFWDGVFPLPDEDGNDGRLSPFVMLNGLGGEGALIQPIRKVALTAGAEPFSFWQYEQAQEISQISDAGKRDARLGAGGASLEAFLAAAQMTPAAFYVSLVAQLEAALAAVDDLSAAFSERVGVDAPPAGAIRSALNSALDAVRTFAADKLAQAEALTALGAEDNAGEDPESATEGRDGATPSAKGAISNREHALRQLLDVAAFFRKQEPHSPISYTLEEIVRRARLPLDKLLEELIVDTDARRYFYLAAGLRPPEPQ